VRELTLNAAFDERLPGRISSNRGDHRPKIIGLGIVSDKSKWPVYGGTEVQKALVIFPITGIIFCRGFRAMT